MSILTNDSVSAMLSVATLAHEITFSKVSSRLWHSSLSVPGFDWGRMHNVMHWDTARNGAGLQDSRCDAQPKRVGSAIGNGYALQGITHGITNQVHSNTCKSNNWRLWHLGNSSCFDGSLRICTAKIIRNATWRSCSIIWSRPSNWLPSVNHLNEMCELTTTSNKNRFQSVPPYLGLILSFLRQISTFLPPGHTL